MCDVLTKRSEVQDMGGAARREAGIIFVKLLLVGRSSDTPAEPHTRCCTMCVFLFLLFSVLLFQKGTDQRLCWWGKVGFRSALIRSSSLLLKTESTFRKEEKRISYNVLVCPMSRRSGAEYGICAKPRDARPRLFV